MRSKKLSQLIFLPQWGIEKVRLNCYLDRMRHEESGHYKEIKRYLDTYGKDGVSWDEKNLSPEILASLQTHLPIGQYVPLILDQGCGHGYKSIILAGRGYRVRGIDIVPKALYQARVEAQKQGVNVKFDWGDVCNKSHLHELYRDGEFDGIFSAGVLHSVHKQGKLNETVEEMTRVLKDDGIVFCAIPFKLIESDGVIFDYEPEIFLNALDPYFILLEKPKKFTRETERTQTDSIRLIVRKR